MVLHRFLSEFWNGDYLASLIYNRHYNVLHMDKNLCGVPGTTFSCQLLSNCINLGREKAWTTDSKIQMIDKYLSHMGV